MLDGLTTDGIGALLANLKQTVNVTPRLRGFILLSVLMFLALMALLVVAVRVHTAAVTQEIAVLHRGTGDHFLVQSGIDLALSKVYAVPEGEPLLPESGFSGSFASGTVSGTITNAAGRVDLNYAELGLLQAAAGRAGYDETRSGEIAARIMDWRDDNRDDSLQEGDDENEELVYFQENAPSRPRNNFFQALEEVSQVAGINSGDVARLAPHVTLVSGIPTVNSNLVDLKILAFLPEISENARIYFANENRDISELDGWLTSDKVKDFVNATELGKGWLIEMEVVPKNGLVFSRNIEILVLGDDSQPVFRVHSSRGALEKVAPAQLPE